MKQQPTERSRQAVTLTGVAQRAGVSAATVSRVLNGNYPVAAATRQRVLDAASELHYVLNAHARALVQASSSLVGLVIHDVTDPYFAEIARGVQAAAERAGRLVIICNSQRDPAREMAYIETLRRQRADTVILAGGAIEAPDYRNALHEHVKGLRSQGSRLVLCGREWRHADSVTVQHRAGARLITQRLLEQGHARIAVVLGPRSLSTTRLRYQGFADALSSAGLAPDKRLMVNGDFTRDGGELATQRLLAADAGFTAMFAANDLMAIGAYAALRRAHLRVPDDVSVVGFDDIPMAKDITPALTTIRVPLQEMGAAAIDVALRSHADDDGQVRRIRLPVELVDRSSVTPPRASKATQRTDGRQSRISS